MLLQALFLIEISDNEMNSMKLSKHSPDLHYLNLDNAPLIHYQLSPSELIEIAVCNGEAKLADSGALAADTGKFTGRSPRDRFIVCDAVTEEAVWWGDINVKFSEKDFDGLFEKVTQYLSERKIFVRDAYACANDEFRLTIRVVTETAYQNLFANNLFISPLQADPNLRPEWTIITAPGFKANPEIDGTRQANFCIINFTRKIILIGGTGYTGEMKKGIFSVLNFILPHQHNVLSMHCSANIGKEGDTAIFFGLSGTGKTTLSADPDRRLIGDDEHGWSKNSVFNFEGGCYAKCVDLSPDKEPQIYKAIRFGSLLENINFIDGTRTVDFYNTEKTENTRVAYPINFIENALIPSIAKGPKNIFFLTADAFGVLPPISRLSPAQAMYHFISGYTAKVAGTEAGITEPEVTFSACFGKAFLPLHPTIYAELLRQNIEKYGVNVWLINTGWTGGEYGTGTRMKLSHTRAMIAAALKGSLNHVPFEEHNLFGLAIPLTCPGVPSEILNPRNTWNDKQAYDQMATGLLEAFVSNFKQYSEYADNELITTKPWANLPT
jgi:phosphoenolpyruvate carboxykinase (ATP)